MTSKKVVGKSYTHILSAATAISAVKKVITLLYGYFYPFADIEIDAVANFSNQCLFGIKNITGAEAK